MKSFSFAAVLFFVLLCPKLWAQGTPFPTDLLSGLTYSENYSETLASDGSGGYTIVPSNSITITGTKFSLTGLTVDDSTAISITVGEFQFDGTLSADPNYTPFDPTNPTVPGVSTLPITSNSLTDADGNPLQVGTVRITWTGTAMGFRVSLTSGEYYVIADQYIDRDWIIDDSMSCSISFAGCTQSSRLVWYHGTATQTTSNNSPTGSLSKVALTGGFDSTAPVADLLDPVPGGKVYYPIINVGGTVSDPQSGPQTVSVKVNGVQTDIDVTGAESWNLPDDSLAHVNEGLNTISIQTRDMDGNQSAWVNYSVNYTKKSLLVVKTSGSGSATFSGTTYQQTGMNLSLTATPATGSVFDHWEGTVGPTTDYGAETIYYSTTAKTSLIMQPFSSLKAVFIPSPFIPVIGTYSGLLISGTQPNLGGAFNLKLTASGAFTGKLTIGGADYQLKGQFNNAGHFSGTFGTKVPMTLSIDLNGTTKRVTGTATQGALIGSIQSDLGVYSSSKNPLLTGTGSYTFLIPTPVSGDTTVPQGTGYGTATINSAGAVTLSGALGDGTKFQTSSVVSKDMTFPVFVSLYNKLGALSGSVAINPVPGVSDFNGTLRWSKPFTSGSFYSSGIGVQPVIIGSRYDKTAPLNFNAGGAYTAIFTSGSNSTLVSSTTSLISLSTTKFGASPLPGPIPNPNKFVFTVVPGTGLFSGSFVNGTSTAINGAVFQKQSLGAGVFVNKTQSGSVLIETGTNANPIQSN